MTHLHSICLITLTAGLLVSCSTGGSGGDSADSSANVTPLSQRLNQEQGYVRDSEGNWLPRSDRRSQFENQRASATESQNSYATRSFGGATEYQPAEWTRQSRAPQPYTGDTDGSGFQTTSAAQGQTARQSGARARNPGQYQTNDFGTGSSRENSARRHDRPSDAQTENRRDSYPFPDVIDWREQRDLSVKESRSMLSR